MVLSVAFIASILSNNSILAAFSAMIGGVSAIAPAIFLAFYLRVKWNFWSPCNSGELEEKSIQFKPKLSVIRILFFHFAKVIFSIALIFIFAIFVDDLDWPLVLVSYFLSLQTYFLALMF